MTIETVPFDAAEFFTTAESQEDLVRDAFASGDARYILKALDVVVRTRGMGEVAARAGITREELQQTLSENADPKLSTLIRVTKALGIRLTASA